MHQSLVQLAKTSACLCETVKRLQIRNLTWWTLKSDKLDPEIPLQKVAALQDHTDQRTDSTPHASSST